ncbi:MAG: hypothetical protein PVI21_02010 [Candidatus Woesebacteria bacterium]|jgi:lysyl-tRNA synthetase class 2
MQSVDEQFVALTKKGVQCYGYEYDFTTTISEFVESQGNKVAGRVLEIDGEALKATVGDATATIKVSFEHNDHNTALLSLFRPGDIVGCEGEWKNDSRRFICRQVTLLTKTRVEYGLPDSRDNQLKLKHLLYINDNNSAKTIFKRSETIRLIRDYLYTKGFNEIDTPLLHPFQGDSTSKPLFVSPSAYDDLQFTLASSPELYLKKMLVSGFNKIFTINKVFRDEQIDNAHLMEFTSIEYYMAYVDYRYMMNFTEKLLKNLASKVVGKKQLPFNGNIIDFNKPWARMSIHKTLKKHFGKDIFKLSYKELLELAKTVDITYENPTSSGNIIIDIFESLYLHTLIQPTFIYDFPKDASVMCYDITMAKDSRENNLLLERFELYIGGMELANCYSELNDPEVQKKAFDNFLKQRNKELNMDATFYHALRVGMPPASGVGFGIDRLLMILTDNAIITEVAPFSTYHESL